MIKYLLTEDNLTIYDSFCISTVNMKAILLHIKLSEGIDSKIWLRSFDSLIKEWKTHNIFYKLGLFRNHTKDVDFEANTKWYFKIGYFIVGSLNT